MNTITIMTPTGARITLSANATINRPHCGF
jgi:hypothetical protein